MSTEHEDRDGSEHEVGSLGTEALRLFGALSGWATQHGSDLHDGAEDAVRHAHDGAQGFVRGMEEHLATGAPECTWCPLCRTIHTVRELSPEVRTHLTAAATSLVSAASALLATAVADQARRAGSRSRAGSSASPGVQHIDLDDGDLDDGDLDEDDGDPGSTS